MRDSTFFRGLLLGLLVGFVVGHFLTAAVPPPPGGGTAEVERLRHQLESTRRERDALEKNIEDFRIVAEKMTAAFESLEKRFRALEQPDTAETPNPSAP